MLYVEQFNVLYIIFLVDTVDYPSVPNWNNDVSYHPLPSPHIPMALRLTGGTRYEGRLEVNKKHARETYCKYIFESTKITNTNFPHKWNEKTWKWIHNELTN